MPGVTLRLTTDASLTAILEERPFFLGDTITLFLGPDETVPSAVDEIGRRFVEETIKYWHDWVRRLAIPFEWQAAVIRAAITLQLNAYDDTGAIVAAMTTLGPRGAGSSRNWDYRYCWLRDGYFVVDALNRLGATETMESYLGYIVGIVAASGELAAAGLSHQRRFRARRGNREIAARLSRHGTGADRQRRLPAGAARRLRLRGPRVHARLLRRAADQERRRRALRAARNARPAARSPCTTKPDAGLWELRGSLRVHTFSSVMCWAACDRLSRIAARLGIADRARGTGARRRAHPALHRRTLLERERGDRSSAPPAATRSTRACCCLPSSDSCSRTIRASRQTVHAIEGELKRGDFIFPLCRAGRLRRARERIRHLLVLVRERPRRRWAAATRRARCSSGFSAAATRHGLLAEHLDPRTGEHWGNFVQTYSMVGLIHSAIRQSAPGTRRSDEHCAPQCAPGRPKRTVRPLGAANEVTRVVNCAPGRPEAHCAPGGSETASVGRVQLRARGHRNTVSVGVVLLQLAPSVIASAIAATSAGGSCAPDTPTRLPNMKNGTPVTPSSRTRRSIASMVSAPASDSR